MTTKIPEWKDIEMSEQIRTIPNVVWNDDLKTEFNFDRDMTIPYINAIIDQTCYDSIIKNPLYVMGTGLLSRDDLTDLFYQKPHEFRMIYQPGTHKMYMQLNDSSYHFWHVFDCSQDLINHLPYLIGIYNPTEYQVEYKSGVVAIIATKQMFRIHDIEDQLFENDYTEVFFWGSRWKDFPFQRREIKNYGHLLHLTAKHAHNQIEQNYYSTSFRTLYSKSIIEIIDVNDSYYLVEIKYCSTNMDSQHISVINKKLERYYPLDLPIDVVLALQEYVFCPEDLIRSDVNEKDKDECIESEG
jgi:hypothetical protein